MEDMFDENETLEEVYLDDFDTSAVKDMRNVFSYCKKLTELDISSFSTKSVTQISAMFMGCTNLTKIYVGSDWKPSSSMSGYSSMFNNCGTSTVTRV